MWDSTVKGSGSWGALGDPPLPSSLIRPSRKRLPAWASRFLCPQRNVTSGLHPWTMVECREIEQRLLRMSTRSTPSPCFKPFPQAVVPTWPGVPHSGPPGPCMHVNARGSTVGRQLVMLCPLHPSPPAWPAKCPGKSALTSQRTAAPGHCSLCLAAVTTGCVTPAASRDQKFQEGKR